MTTAMSKSSAVLLDIPMTPTQCRAARAMLKWKQTDLAARAGVAVMTVRNFEGELTEPTRATVAVMWHALEAAGIEFVGDHGVHLNPKPETKK